MGESSEVEYAGFWIRSLAMAVDLAIFVIPFVLISTSSVVLAMMYDLPGKYFSKGYTYVYLAILYLIVLPCYFIARHIGEKQATIGKEVCGIYVVNKSDHTKINACQAFGRYIFAVLLPPLTKFCNLALYIMSYCSLFMAGLAPQKTALHDIIFKTRVVKAIPRLQGSKSLKSYYMTFTILLLILGAVMSLFSLKKAFFLAVVITIYIILLSLSLLFYKFKKPDIYMNYQFLESLKVQKPLFISLAPSVICLTLTYTLTLYTGHLANQSFESDCGSSSATVQLNVIPLNDKDN
jgi:uncharacterized RDD family membrane protein YckC